jgi:hypothetical protein
MKSKSADISHGNTLPRNNKITKRIWSRQRRFAVWKRGWIAAILFFAISAHASPHYFHLRVQHPNLQKILKALHELEQRKVVAR